MESRDDGYVGTYTGKLVNVIDPNPDDFDIVDIAHALSNTCRWGGHCKYFASVGEHSISVSLLCKREDALAGLLHDASEAYIADIVKTVKRHLSNYKAIEDRIMRAIATKFKFQYPLPESVHAADLQQLSTEAHYVMVNNGNHFDWDKYSPTGRPEVEKGFRPIRDQPGSAKNEFIKRYYEIISWR